VFGKDLEPILKELNAAPAVMVPGWSEATIGELIGSAGLFVNGDWIETKDQDPDGEVRLIQLADIGDGIFLNRSHRFLTLPTADRLGCTFLQEGDLLVARMPDPLGRATIFPGDEHRSVTAIDVCIIRAGQSRVNHRWLMWTVNSPAIRQSIAALQRGTTRTRISRRNLAAIKVPVPPSAEQERIVAEIDKQFTGLDAAVAALKRAKANLERYRAAVLKAACEGRLVPTEAELASREGRSYEVGEQVLARILKERRANWEADQLARMHTAGTLPKNDDWKRKYREPPSPDTTNLPRPPEGWAWVSLDQVFLMRRGRLGVRPRSDPRYFGGCYPFVQIGDLPSDGGTIRGCRQTLNEKGVLVSKIFPKGSVLLAIVGDTIAKTGILSFDSCCPDSLVGLHGASEPLSSFAEAYLTSTKLSLRRASYASGGQPNINLAMLRSYPLPLPPEAEQTRIAMKIQCSLSTIDALQKTVSRRILSADRLRQSILKSAFEGRLVPHDP
jgi:type I restriction enzyme S subunit